MDSDSSRDGVPRRWRGDGVEQVPEAVDYVHGDEVNSAADADVGPEARPDDVQAGRERAHPDTGEDDHVDADE